ncbi:MAG: hypothetical protein GTO53_08145 [Planctomycetales bacterium]|nr:hypothetical protein [Planctomycetales bacterium]NIM09103.1 hypothetical protein [Planctomycetales bacterium]NIN08574.1 hypothetical protein [Planctomycetales bacterium]NIN77696.1 hypothetical protein [Planctomycetales bacterium]NIO34872.1 hypothetical protein [Planctomycetales bacterium]
MTALYDKSGVTFEYPENWSLDEDALPPQALEVTVRSPRGGFWSVRFERAAVDPHQLAQTAVAAMRDEYAGLEVEPVHELVEGVQLVGMDMSFFYLDLTSTAQVRALQTLQGTYLLLCQAEDSDFDQLQPVFRALTASLLRRTC